MYISEIQKRLMNLVNQIRFDRAKGFVLLHGANDREMTDAYHVALWIEGAPKEVKSGFLELWEESSASKYMEDCGLRICDTCGQFMTEGYLLGGDMEHYCSRECAIQSYIKEMWDGDAEDHAVSHEQAEAAFDYDLEQNEEDYFWTEWYQG